MPNKYYIMKQIRLTKITINEAQNGYETNTLSGMAENVIPLKINKKAR